MHRIQGAKHHWYRRPRYRKVTVLTGLVLLVLAVVSYQGHVVSGAPVLPGEVAAELQIERAVYRTESELAHELWLVPDPTQVPIPVVRAGRQILSLDAGKLRGTRATVPQFCTPEVGGTIKKLRPDHRGFIAVEYGALPTTSQLDPRVCAGGDVTFMDRALLNYFIGAEVLR